MQQGFQAKNSEIDGRVTKLEKELSELKQSLTKQTSNEKPSGQIEQPGNAGKQEANHASQSNAEPVGRVGEARIIGQQPEEEKAEKWLRENLEKWLDQPCSYGKALGRTWRDLAENKGEKINLKGNDSVPRAYLHAIENWPNCKSVWTKMKAKVALEVIKKETSGYSHYSHPAEIGG